MNIEDIIKTPRHGDANRPFGTAPMVKTPVKPTDPSMLEVCDDPIPAHRASAGNKYEAVLKTLKLGQCIKCAPSEIGRISSALRKYIAVNKNNATVRTIKNYGDGKGRVWMLAIEKKLKVAA